VPLAPPAPPALGTTPPAPIPPTYATTTFSPENTGARAKQALRSKWLPVLLVSIIAYLDYLTHSDAGPAVQIIVGSLVMGLILFGGEIGERTGLSATFRQIPPKLRPVLMAIPPAMWFLLRDEGTSGAGIGVMLVSVGLVASVSYFGEQIDGALRGFYRTRNRTLPRKLRIVLAIVLPILISAVIVHGSLDSLAVLFQGTTSSAKSAEGQAGVIVFAALLSAVVALLLLRDAEA
jgi:hypothetical protein